MADPREQVQESGSVTWRSYVHGPRWAAFGKAFRDRVWTDPHLELVACEDEKGLIRTTTRFEVRGSRRAVTDLQRDLVTSVEGWNDDRAHRA